MIDYSAWGVRELVERINEYESLKRCPMCTDGKLEHRHIEPVAHNPYKAERPHHGGHHSHVCDSCPFIGFEYYNPLDIKALQTQIK